MIIQARINGDDNNVFNLAFWDAVQFNNVQSLTIQSNNFARLKQVFSNISKIEIFVSGNLVAQYTSYDSFSEMIYKGEMYIESENAFAETIEVKLTKMNLVDQVERIQKEVDKVVDIDSMSTEEYRQYLLSVIGQKCQQQIYDGDYVNISTGSKKFTYNAEDQINIQNAVSILKLVPTLDKVPYHASKNSCYLMDALDLLTVYMTLQTRLTYLTTRGNAFNMWIQNTQTKEELMNITWESELPQEYQENVETIYSYALYIAEEVAKVFHVEERQAAKTNTAVTEEYAEE